MPKKSVYKDDYTEEKSIILNIFVIFFSYYRKSYFEQFSKIGEGNDNSKFIKLIFFSFMQLYEYDEIQTM